MIVGLANQKGEGMAGRLEIQAGVETAILRQKSFFGKPQFLFFF